MEEIRRQLTLFIENETIEKVRVKFNPAQHALISAHVTLCREDELEDLDTIIANIKSLKINKPIRIIFNDVERFENGKGALIPACKEGTPLVNHANDHFHNLRDAILISPRKHLPHITLMHPRNSTCTDSIFEEIKSFKLPATLFFNKISLIEQKSGGKWKVLDEFSL
ncbi:2'-5' RNA ligase family protein [Pedobacter polaris]|uniref:2'-5' RNA ligase family protein n=1 Tax=Pedobacter polaris TaxID=2571273 RepID=A0A4U1CTL3_9SPHI|nr:2'-5' RNA ligase family protein [Pedobacter polaris]TKC12541.1 2'-5' RNA ligase family protein [Pedobacter polaris]